MSDNVRPILELPRGPDGLFLEPTDSDPETLQLEDHNRERFAKKANYADPYVGDGRTVDPTGRYNCGGCNQEEGGACEWVDVAQVDLEAGSCRVYETICGGDPEIRFKRATIAGVGYAVAKNGEGFGCARCPFQQPSSRGPDDRGRDLWCGEGGFRVFPTACCEYNGAETEQLDEKGKVMRSHRTMLRRLMTAEVQQLGDHEVEVIMSTSELARDGHVLEPKGLDLSAYRANPIVLWQHDPEQPIGTASDFRVDGDKLRARITFAPAGISAKADEVRGLVKAGIVKGVSIGFDPVEATPLDKQKPRGGQHIKRAEVYECSFVSVPADTGAQVTARDHNSAAADAGRAQRQENVLTETPKERRVTPQIKRDLYAVAQLAYICEQLGYATGAAAWESEVEGDDSAVPAMLARALESLLEGLKAMTDEEAGELLAALGGGDDEDGERSGLSPMDREFIGAAKGARGKAWRRAWCLVRGKKDDGGEGKTLVAVDGHHTRALKHGKALDGHHRALGGHLEAMRDAVDGAKDAHGKAGEHLDKAKEAAAAGKADDAGKHIERAAKACAAASGYYDDHEESRAAASDAHEDAQDCSGGMTRSVKAASRGVRSLIDGAEPGAEDGDSQDVQTSAGTKDSKGSSNDRDIAPEFRRDARAAALAALAPK